MLPFLAVLVLLIVSAALVVRPPSVAAHLDSSSSQPAPQLVGAAVDGVDAVIVSIGARPSRKETYVFSQGMQNVLAALASRPEVVVISVTGIGAGDSRGHGGFGYDSIIQPVLLTR